MRVTLGGPVPIAGVDEVGRGPLCGPVVACAVILRVPVEGLADSKVLRALERQRLAALLQANAVVALGAASVAEIARLNILHASMLAMRRAVARLKLRPAHVLIDGNRIPPGLDLPAEAIVKGDALVDCIAAASIVAKVVRDRAMARLALRWPGYGLERHAGYPTEIHRRALRELGPTPHHRLGFRGVLSPFDDGLLDGGQEADDDEASPYEPVARWRDFVVQAGRAEALGSGSMDQAAVMAEFEAAEALLRGHFILTSGLRSSVYLQCARVLMDPARAERLARALAANMVDLQVDLVVSPAMGGILVGHELARALGVPSVFTERVDGAFTLRRGFSIPKDARIVVAEDVVTTGMSTRECMGVIRALGGEVVAAACLVDRSGGRADLGVPHFALMALDLPTFRPDEVPPELAAIPPVKPGSRPGLAKA